MTNKYKITITNDEQEVVFQATATGEYPPYMWADHIAQRYGTAHICMHDMTNGIIYNKDIGE